jgi:hypothetical protein
MTYQYEQKWYVNFYPWWIYVCMLGMGFSMFRSPRITWLGLILIIGTRIFIPNIIGLSHWRYTLAGLVPLQIVSVCWFAGLMRGGVALFKLPD